MKRLLVFVFAIMPLLAFATDEICPAGYQPAEYVELEYIESTGTQYIDTGVMFNIDNIYYIIQDIQSLSGNTTMGSGWNAGGSVFVQSGSWSDGLNRSDILCRSRIISAQIINSYASSTTDTTILEKETGITDNLSRAHASLNAYAEGFGYPLLCSTDVGSRPYGYMHGRLFSASIKVNDILVRNFIPVRRASDGAVGMFDRVGGKFYGNDGTGEFIAGPEIGQSFIADENSDIVCVSCPANTYKPNAGNVACTKCPEHTFSPVGSKELGDCAKILRVKDYVVYMPLGKRTEHGLCVMSDGKKYCADVYERQ